MQCNTIIVNEIIIINVVINIIDTMVHNNAKQMFRMN